MKNTINTAFFNQARKYQSSNPLLNAIILILILVLIPLLLILGALTLVGIGVYAYLKTMLKNPAKTPLKNKKQEAIEYADYEVIESEPKK